jgi:hypothetical protein
LQICSYWWFDKNTFRDPKKRHRDHMGEVWKEPRIVPVLFDLLELNVASERLGCLQLNSHPRTCPTENLSAAVFRLIKHTLKTATG